MTTVDVTIIDQGSSEGSKRDLATRLTDVLIALDRKPEEPTRWRVVARAVPATAVPERGTDPRLAGLDYAAWHAHLAGAQRWNPSRHRGITT